MLTLYSTDNLRKYTGYTLNMEINPDLDLQ